MTLGLALEGGGAKGSYQVGAYLALIENGYKFDYIVGTSIGAINGVMMVQGQEEELVNLWETISYSDIIDIDEEIYEKIVNESINLENAIIRVRYLLDVVKNGGLSTDLIKGLFEKYVDEEAVRNSEIKFGLATLNLTDKKYEELFIDDIPKGELNKYIMGSANLPAFKQENIKGEKHLLDGGVYKNNPYEMLLDKCDKIISILIFQNKAEKKLEENPKVDIIKPCEKLCDVLDFNTDHSKYNIKLGYYDGFRYIKNYLGEKYYIEEFSQDKAFEIIKNVYYKLVDKDSTPKILGQIDNFINFKENIDYVNILVERLEFLAGEYKIERFKVYTIEELALLINKSWNNKNNSLFNFLDKLIIETIIKIS